MTISQIKEWLSRTVGVDKAVFYSIMGKIWQIIAGIVSIVLIARFITRSEQGYLYTFQSLLSFQFLFDLSLSTVLIQFAGHEMAHLKWKTNGTIDGDSVSKSRLSSLIRFAFKWYSFAAVLMLVLLTSGGYTFFITQEVPNDPVIWRTPWMLLCAALSISMIFAPILGIIEGCGRVAEVAFFRMIQDSASYTIYWIALISGLRLFALPILFFSRVVAILIYLFIYRRDFLFDLGRTQISQKVNFKQEIWPFQWRFFLCSLAGLLASLLTIPIIFTAQGPVVAGQLGMTLSITGAVFSVSMVWINTKVPLFCNLVALKNYSSLDRIFRTVNWQSFSVMLVLSGGIILLVLAVKQFTPGFAMRLADPMTVVLLLLAVLLAFPNFALSAYLRTHKREVTVFANLSIALIMLCLIYFIAFRHSGLLYIAVVQAVSNGVLSFWVYLLFRKYKQLWHI